MWHGIEEAQALCCNIQAALPRGWWCGLTGGLLYKLGPRKDCDILLYRARKAEDRETDDILVVLRSIRDRIPMFELGTHTGFVTKCRWRGRSVDLLYPEATIGAYCGR